MPSWAVFLCSCMVVFSFFNALTDLLTQKKKMIEFRLVVFLFHNCDKKIEFFFFRLSTRYDLELTQYEHLIFFF